MNILSYILSGPPFKFPPRGKRYSFPRGGREGWGSGCKILQLVVFLIISQAISAYGQAERKFIRQGNSKFSSGKFPDSETAYRKAIDKNKMSQDAVFNLGDALYKQKKYEEAAKQFLDNSGATIDKKKKANSYFNLGNSMFSNKKLEESIEAFKNCLRLDPENREAKYNLAYVQDQLRDQQNKKDNNQKQEEPSDFAKKLKAQADKLIAEGRFAEAFNLLQEGLKKDKTVNYYRDYIDKTGKVAAIDVQLK